MKTRGSEGIEFPANPFVVLADFIIILLMIMILTIAYQSVSSGRLIERAAIFEVQKRLETELTRPAPHARNLLTAVRNHRFMKSYSDGDLQRFWLDGDLCFEFGQDGFKGGDDGVATQVLRDVGAILVKYQGEKQFGSDSLFKRISVEGHTDERERGNDTGSWELSTARARNAVTILQRAGIKTALMEASGRGSAVPVSGPPLWFANSHHREPARYRIEIVIAYSGTQVLNYRSPGASSR